jgi:hypothetical protein
MRHMCSQFLVFEDTTSHRRGLSGGGLRTAEWGLRTFLQNSRNPLQTGRNRFK